MLETPFFFASGQHQLFGVFHDPGAAPTARLPFVFCHPFGEEKLWAHRVFVTFARALAQRGHPVLRFDYAGNGDSGGDFRDSTVVTALADIGCAVDVLKERCGAPTVGLLGLRLGATLANHLAGRRSDVSALILWAPVVQGERYMQELLRINLTTQMAVFKQIRADRAQLVQSLRDGQPVNVDGYEVMWPMYEQVAALTLEGACGPAAGRRLIVQVERAAGAPPSRELEALAAGASGTTLEIVQEEPFWKEILRFYETAPELFARTQAWLERP